MASSAVPSSDRETATANSRSALVVALCVTATAQVRAQELLRQHDDRYRNSSMPLGDVDADGVTDLLVGAFFAPDPAGVWSNCGAAFVYSGSDGRPLRSLHGGATGASLYAIADAANVARLSDHDHDGVHDLALVGDVDTRVVSGASGTTLATITTSTSYGGSVAEVDDLDGDGDGDGEPELALGERDAAPLFSGQVRVDSIPTLTTLRLHAAAAHWGLFGMRIASGFDADRDGVRDDLGGAPLFQLAAFGTADVVEAFSWRATVPAGRSGMEATLRVYGLGASGKLIVSAGEVVAFQ